MTASKTKTQKLLDEEIIIQEEQERFLKELPFNQLIIINMIQKANILLSDLGDTIHKIDFQISQESCKFTLIVYFNGKSKTEIKTLNELTSLSEFYNIFSYLEWRISDSILKIKEREADISLRNSALQKLTDDEKKVLGISL